MNKQPFLKRDLYDQKIHISEFVKDDDLLPAKIACIFFVSDPNFFLRLSQKKVVMMKVNPPDSFLDCMIFCTHSRCFGCTSFKFYGCCIFSNASSQILVNSTLQGIFGRYDVTEV